MPVLDLINFYVIPGLVLGSIYAVGSIGITLVFAILRFAHIAHGDLATLGAFLALSLVTTLQIDPWLALPVSMVVAGGVAVGIDRVFYEGLVTRPKIVTLIASLGIGLMVRSLIQVFWGVDTESYVRGIVRPETFWGLRVKPHELYTVAAMIGLVAALWLFLMFSRWGKAMRAMSDNRDLARLSGVDVRLVTTITWFIVGALCAAAGFLLGVNAKLTSMMGWEMLMPMFAGAVLGGVGKVEGAVVGGLVLGLVEELSVLVLPPEYKTGTAFAVLLLILLFRPTGLLRGKII